MFWIFLVTGLVIKIYKIIKINVKIMLSKSFLNIFNKYILVNKKNSNKYYNKYIDQFLFNQKNKNFVFKLTSWFIEFKAFKIAISLI